LRVMRNWRIPLLILIDTALVNLSYLLSFYYRYSFDIPKEYLDNYIRNEGIMFLIYAVVFTLFRLYKSLWQHAGTDEFLLAIAGIMIASSLNSAVSTTMGRGLPLSVHIMAAFHSIVFVCGFRIAFRIYRRITIILDKPKAKQITRVMVIGAGSASAHILREMKRHKEIGYIPVAVIDDDPSKHGTFISGIEVCGDRHKIQQVTKEKRVETIIIAITTLNEEEKREVIEICRSTGCKLKIVPGTYEIIDDRYLLSKFRDIDVEDLLGREPVRLEIEGISKYVENKIVLVTGGGGSIGSELCRQIVRFNPKQLIIIDAYENNAYDIQRELSYSYPGINLKVLIATIRDKNRFDKIFRTYKPQLVFHAAAHKHVPLMEDSPCEAVKNNVFGTLNLSECADKYDVERFIMISTDKAVNPTNIMGATKRICEMIIQGMDKASKTEFVAVRFGNVLGSNGSVIPLFKKQIARGGPITLTHKDITRFFMTIPEAAQLVMQAGAFAKGGEIFVLDMGKPVRIYDLACEMIKLSGLKPEKDIEIKITGLRAGEKLYEELLMNSEGLATTKHEKIFIEEPMSWSMEELRAKLKDLRKIVELENEEELFKKMAEIVPTYKRRE
jgi:FlaA1/EpsC-like NDP-sugar epimerase